MQKKKGIELSINFFVIIVLSVVIFGIGIKLLYDMCSKVGCFSEPDLIDSSCSDKNMDMLLADSRVAVCPSDMTIPKARTGTFKIGILNPEAETKFRVNLKVSAGTEKNGADIISLPAFIFTQMSAYDIKTNKDKKALVKISVPSNAPSGTYSVDVKVCSGSSNAPDEAECDLTDPPFGLNRIYIHVP